jgi:hypothetical protein
MTQANDDEGEAVIYGNFIQCICRIKNCIILELKPVEVAEAVEAECLG